MGKTGRRNYKVEKKTYVVDKNVDRKALETIWNLKSFLRKNRIKAKISQTEVARKLGVTPPAVSKFETSMVNIPNLDTIIRYAKTIGLEKIVIELD